MFRLALLSLLLSTAAVADSPREKITELQEALGLTSTQVDALQEVQQSLREDARPVLVKLRADERQLRTQRTADTPDAGVVSMLEAQVVNGREQLGVLRSQALAQAKSILTPDQAAALEQLSSAGQPNELTMLAVRYNLLERPGAPNSQSARPRANQGDFRSNGERR